MNRNLMLAFFALTFLAVSCKSTQNDPKETLKSFIHALANQNIEEAKRYVTKDSEPVMSMIEMGMRMAPDSAKATQFYKEENITMGEAKIDGNTARVPVKEKQSGEETVFTLKQENKEWKVAFDKATLMEMAQKQMKEKGVKLENDEDFDPSSLSMDSIKDAYRNMTPQEKEKLNTALDSATKMLEKLKDEGKLNQAMDSATKLMEKMKQ